MNSTAKTLRTKQEVAHHLRASISTIDRWTKDGKIPSIKIGRRVLFDLDAILAEKSNKQTQPA